jgi:hypothetical protein
VELHTALVRCFSAVLLLKSLDTRYYGHHRERVWMDFGAGTLGPTSPIERSDEMMRMSCHVMMAETCRCCY